MAQLSNLQQREQEYRRLNEEMEQKTAVLMQEAEHMLRKHEALLAEKPAVEADSRDALARRSVAPKQQESSLMAAVAVDLEEDDMQSLTEGSSTLRTKVQRRVLLSASERTTVNGDNAANDVPLPPGSSARRSAPPVRATTIANSDDLSDTDNPAIPATAGQMSVEAQLRFFKAKVRVLQDELDRTQHELASRVRESDSLTKKLQESDEDRNRLTRQVASLQQTLTKQKKLADDNEARATALERTLEAVRRDAESAKRENKKATTDRSAHEVRLNRAVEEAEHLRQELAKARAAARDVNSDESRKVEKLSGEVRKLERQRTELIAAFKKSLKLIDVLKRQKLHLEAARLLQFREEEFVRALDWDHQGAAAHEASGPISSGVRNNNKTSSGAARRGATHAGSNSKTSSNTAAAQNLVVEGNAEPLFDDFGDGEGDNSY